jgi:hypothetical protein
MVLLEKRHYKQKFYGLKRVLSYRGRNCLLGPGKHLVWQIEVTIANFLFNLLFLLC